MSGLVGNPLFFSTTGSTQYQIERSLRFNSSDSAKCARTYSSGSSTTTQTLSLWVKRAKLGATGCFWSGYDGSAAYGAYFQFDSTDTLTVILGGASLYQLTTTQVFRDPSSWYHIVLTIDTNNGTSGDRIRLYVNGSRVTTFSTASYPTSGYACQFAMGNANNTIGTTWGSSAYSFFDGYLADIHFIDGQALTPTSFGGFDVNNVWQPKAYTGTFTGNSFWLKFADNSAATATTLGKDSSALGNNWTPNNLSVTAGAGNDSLVDTPTSYGTDTGAGSEVRGNYCTLNPLNTSSIFTLSNGNLNYLTATAANMGSSIGTIGVSSGKWYWEGTLVSARGSFGVARQGAGITVDPGTTSLIYYYRFDGNKYNNGGSAYGATYAANDVIGVALDLDAGTLTFYKNGVSQGIAFSSLPSDTYFPQAGDDMTSFTTEGILNFGQRPFAFPVSGFKALCTANLPTPTIANPATAMDVVLYTGTGATLTPTSTLGFSPDLVWIKSRSAATDNTLYDSVRGAQARLESNTTDAEVTSDNGLTAFNSNGFTLGTLAQVNTNAATYVAWTWDAGSSTVTNTQGSITSSVRTNGYLSIVTWTGSNTASTIGHGLGVAPAFIITKSRNNAIDWQCYHIALGKDKTIAFNSTAAAATVTNYWGSAEPTSTVFGTRNASGDYNNTGNMVAYCFAPVAGYSSFGSYTGNGSTDGPFVYTGFRPRWILLKDSTNVANWELIDTARIGYNGANYRLYPNLSDAETADNRVDILSNGFKIRTGAGTAINTSNAVVVYAAFAENPFQYARAR